MARNGKDELLKHIRFDQKINKSLIYKYLSNPRPLVLVLIFVISLGLSAFLSLPRDLNPQINIPIVAVSTVLPGASPADVESLVTIPIENSINGLDKVKTITSNSQDNVSLITVEFESGTDPEKAKSDVQSAVDSIGELPEDALKPQVLKFDFENAPVWTFVLTGSVDDGSLFKFAKNLENKLEDLSEIDKVEISGIEDTEIQITISPGAYISYGANPFQISSIIQTSLRSFPAGSVKTDNSSFSLTVDPQIITVEDIRNVRLNLGEQLVLLSDIALVSEHPKPEQGQSFLAYPNEKTKRSVTFNIFRNKNVNINKATSAAEKKIDEEIEATKNKFKTTTVLNTSEEVDLQFYDLTRDFLITVSLVMLVLFIFLGPRQAFISALSAPLSFFITFIVMQIAGISLNFLSLFSLILSLGLLVDDTVVVISAMSAYYKTRRFTPLQTGLLVWRDFLIPVFTTTITTVWAFIPLLLSSGLIGEFIKSIPIIVSTSLIASFFVGMFITLPLMVVLLKPSFPKRVSILLKIVVFLFFVWAIILLLPKGNLFVFELISFALVVGTFFLVRKELVSSSKTRLSRILTNIRRSNPSFYKISKKVITKDYSEGLVPFDNINIFYKRLIERIIGTKRSRRMVIAMVIIFSIFSFLLLPFGFVKNEFFPEADQELIYMSVELPSGTSLEKTKNVVLPLMDSIKNSKGVKYVSVDLGRLLNLEMGGSQSGGGNNALISINLIDKGMRSESTQISKELRAKYENYPKAKLSIIDISGGPPAGADIQIKLSGQDLGTLDQKADQLVLYLSKQQGVTNISKSIKPGTSKLSFISNKAILADNNIGVEQLGAWLRLYSSGIKAEDNKFPGEEEDKDIVLRVYPEVSTVEGISQISIPTQNGNLPLMSLGETELKINPSLITREDGKRTISVSAAITSGFSISDINSRLEKYADSDLNLPTGYEWTTGGVNEENQNSVNSILQAMVLSFMLIIITMVIQFSSFRRALIVMLVIPLSISGVFIMFALTRTPLSFPALIGLLALFGIVVKNSILLVDKIVDNQKHNMPFVEAIGEASASRLEPIILTSIATILGLIPITVTDPLWRGLGGAIIAGLSFSGITMLFFIPVMYYIVFQDNYKKRR